jgi:hypothetical protein
MKKIALSFATIIFALAAYSSAFAQTAQFVGNWENVDSNTSGVTKLNINKFQLFGVDIITLRAFGQCSPTDCDWGTVVATAYAPNVSSNLENTARALTATYNPGFAVKQVVIRPLSGERLQADIYTRFTDGSGRTNYNASYIFKREGAGNDCLFYDPRDLKIVDEGATGWLLTDGRSRMLILDNREDADRALALARRHNAHCFIGRDNTRPNRRDYVHEYWLGDSGIASVINNEDVIKYDPSKLFIVDEGANGWLLTEGGTHRMMLLDNKQDAEEALAVAKQNNYYGFIGRNNNRPNRREYIVEYFR